MVLDLNETELEELEKLLYVLETHPQKLRALVAENIKLRQFLSAVRRYHRYQHATVQHMMEDLPRADGSKAWESLVLVAAGESPPE